MTNHGTGYTSLLGIEVTTTDSIEVVRVQLPLLQMAQ